MLTLNDGRSELWQWDTGRTLSVDADCSQVHFSNKVFGRSIDVDVVDGVAIIPDVLLQTDKDLNVWAFVGTAENGYTKISKTFRVNRRNKPADYVFTPVEQTTIAEIYAIAQSVRDDADAGLFDGNPGENGRDGVDGKDGAPGKDGTSATHSWNGTVLTITSASGTSSSDLKGDKGDKGNTGPAGKDGTPGADGKTPEYGVDYGTPEQIAGIAQSAAEILQPEINLLKNDLYNLTNDENNYVASFELGNINMTSSGNIYVNSNSRIRTPLGKEIELNCGDKISCDDWSNIKMYVSVLNSINGKLMSQGWLTRDLVVTVSGKYTLLLTNVSEQTLSSVSDISSHITIKRYNSKCNFNDVYNSNIYNDVSSILHHNMFNGYMAPNISLNLDLNTHSNRLATKIMKFENDVIIEYPLNYTVAIWYMASTNYDSSNSVLYDFGYMSEATRLFIPKNKAFYLLIKRNDNNIINPNEIYNFKMKLLDDNIKYQQKTNIISINHRGYNTIAPENTLPAYILSKKNGFDYVETDVNWTSDNVPVLLHDDTIDRTSNGTGSIGSITFEQVRQYDFGSWKSSEYEGTKIPSFEEFVSTCMKLDLRMYIEIKKSTNVTTEKLNNLICIIKKYNMIDKTTFISFDTNILHEISKLDETVRLGQLFMETSNRNLFYGSIFQLNTGKNEVFFDIYDVVLDSYNSLIDETNSIVEAYTFNTEESILYANERLTGFTSDNLIAQDIFIGSLVK